MREVVVVVSRCGGGGGGKSGEVWSWWWWWCCGRRGQRSARLHLHSSAGQSEDEAGMRNLVGHPGDECGDPLSLLTEPLAVSMQPAPCVHTYPNPIRDARVRLISSADHILQWMPGHAHPPSRDHAFSTTNNNLRTSTPSPPNHSTVHTRPEAAQWLAVPHHRHVTVSGTSSRSVHQKADVPRLTAAVHQSTHADRAVYRYIRYLMYRGRRGTSAVHQI